MTGVTLKMAKTDAFGGFANFSVCFNFLPSVNNVVLGPYSTMTRGKAQYYPCCSELAQLPTAPPAAQGRGVLSSP